MVNGQNYDGSTPIVENDIISFYFYFSDNNRPWTLNQNPQPKALVNTVNSYASSTVVYSIGSTQFNLSISPEVLYKTKPIRIIDIYDNKNVNVSASVTIDFDGTYHLPGNFLTATGTGAELYFILNGTTTVQGGVYVNLLLNDYIQIYNIFTSA
ncbi:hypothetical protein EBU71_09025, partial [bacterium]|nr:hypothetical protein [Candidatus Elulimicrobium humile]